MADYQLQRLFCRGDSVLGADARECSLCNEITWGSVTETRLAELVVYQARLGVWHCIIWLESRLPSVRVKRQLPMWWFSLFHLNLSPSKVRSPTVEFNSFGLFPPC